MCVRRAFPLFLLLVSLFGALSASAAPWLLSGQVRVLANKIDPNSSSIAISLVVTDEQGAPVKGLKANNFDVHCLVSGATSHVFNKAELSGASDTFQANDNGTYIVYFKTNNAPSTIKGASVAVILSSGQGAGVKGAPIFTQKTAVFIPASP